MVNLPVPPSADRVATRLASYFLIAVGAVVLVGWILGLPALQGLSGAITMKANAAIGLLTAGLALRLRTSVRPWAAIAGRSAAVLVGAVGAATFSEHLVGWELGIDELLFTEPPGAAATTSPGRMGPNASLSLMLGGIALWQLYRGDERSVVRAQILGALMLVLALVPIVGYAYGATGLYAVARYTGIALHTGIALFVLGFAIIAARPDVGPAAAFSSDAPHSVVARRLLVQTFVLVVTLGYVRLVGERRGWYDTGFGAAFMVVVTVVLLSFTIWRAAVALGHSERARQKAQQDLDALLVSERSARELAERADGAKDEFIATLSHELRTPLNAIIGWTQMLQRGNVPEATRGKATEVVFRNATVLARLIDDLLETSRIATGNLELSQASVDLDAVVHAAIDAVMPVAQGKDLSITLDSAPGLPRVIGDAGRLQQVIWNLLSNAIKFSTRGGQVGVTVSAVADGVIVRVRDHGPGIDAVLMPHVFDRFRQGAPSESGGTGLGLGLYIAKHIVERHGGTIRVESAGAGAGAMFTVALPTATAIEQV